MAALACIRISFMIDSTLVSGSKGSVVVTADFYVRVHRTLFFLQLTAYSSLVRTSDTLSIAQKHVALT